MITLLRRIAQAEDGLDFSVINPHDAKLAANLAELERHGLIKTDQRPSPWMNSRVLTAMATDLGNVLVRTPPSSPDSPR